MEYLATTTYQPKDKRWTSAEPTEASNTARPNVQSSSVASKASTTRSRRFTTSAKPRLPLSVVRPQNKTKGGASPNSVPRFTTGLAEPRSTGATTSPSDSSSEPSNRSNSHAPAGNSELGTSARNALIIATVVGGTLLLALLVCLVWRKRRRSPPVATSLTYYRPPSTVTFFSVGTRDANLTALPMYRERRRDMDEIAKKSSEPRIRELYTHDPPDANLWKTANPPTPLSSQFPIQHEDDGLQDHHIQAPEMSLAPGTTPTIRLSSHGNSYYTVAESIYPPSEIDLETAARLETPRSDTALRDRWSWTTSYTSARSRLDASSLGSTIGSLPGVRTMKEWMGFQSEAQRRLDSCREGDAGPSRSGSFGSAFFKNKATKPNLAPSPVSDYYLRDESRLSGTKHGSTSDVRAIDDIDAIVLDDGVIS